MIRETFHYDNNKTTILRTQDVTADLKRIAMLRDNIRPGSEFRHVGSVPMVIAEEWARQTGTTIGTAEFSEVVRSKLMNGEFAKLATGRF